MDIDGQTLLIKGLTGDSTQPGSGATVTLWTSDVNGFTYRDGARWKRAIVNIYSSHVSATNGLQFDESHDGINWHNIVSYTISATTYTKNYVLIGAPYWRVRYVNSANVLSTWEMSVLGDLNERATQ